MHYTSKELYEFISKETQDPIVEWRTCTLSGAEFPIYQSDLDFYDKISPTFNGVKYQIPVPTICPEERQRRRLMFRNERKLYKGKCEATGKNIISSYSPDKKVTVYDQSYRWSDKWNAIDYGREFDFSKSFTEQFGELLQDVPTPNLYNPSSENCNYINISLGAKNCYLSYVATHSEEVYFSHWAIYSKRSLDLYRCTNCEDCYFINGGKNLYACSYSYELEDSSDCHYSVKLKGCTNCFLCDNLVNKSYCIQNQQYTKEEYLKQVEALKKEDINRLYMSLLQTTIREATTNYSGEHVYGTGNFGGKNLVFCSNLDEGEDNKYYEEGAKGLASCMDCNYGISSTRSFESLSPANGHKMLFVYFSVGGENMLYSYLCFSCKNCFGCVGLQHKQYCIFNKQYSKEEYEKLVPKIIEHMQSNGERGTFFDSSLTPYGYNETIAFEYMPLTKEEALARGYKRQDNNYDPIIPDGATLLTGDQIPTDISIVSDDILNTIFICEDSKRPFRIIKQELDFYRKHKLPLPRKHPDVRHQIRLDQRPGRSFHLKNCDKCKKEMISMFPQDYKGTVYCSSCYQQEFYS